MIVDMTDVGMLWVTRTQLGDRTKLRTLVQCESKAQRDAIIDSGMEGGMQEAFDLLEEIAELP